MIKFSEKDILSIEADYIVNAANSVGWMGGILGRIFKSNGVAETIHYFTKGKVERTTQLYSLKNRVRVGDVFVTHAGNLSFKGIIHVVTVWFPGFLSSPKTVERGIKNLVKLCEEQNIETVVLTGLGTGTGMVSIDKVAHLYCKYLKNTKTTFIIADKNKLFIEKIKEIYSN